MKRLVVVVIFISFLFRLPDRSMEAISQEPEKTNALRFSKQALQEDFTQFRQILENNHAALYEYTPRHILDSLMENQYALIQDSMALHEFFVLLTPIVAKIGCGHTTVWMPMSYWDQGQDNLFPLQIRLIENLVVVSGSYKEEE